MEGRNSNPTGANAVKQAASPAVMPLVASHETEGALKTNETNPAPESAAKRDVESGEQEDKITDTSTGSKPAEKILEMTAAGGIHSVLQNLADNDGVDGLTGKGKSPTGEKINILEKAPTWKRTEINNEYAGFRGKENAELVDQNENFSPMFSKTVRVSEDSRIREHTQRNMQHLQAEFAFLEKLKDTGVTPEPLLLKTNPDNTESHLLMKKVNGQSLEQRKDKSDSDKDKLDAIILSMSTSLDKVHKKGVLVTDINNGTFIIDGLDNDTSDLSTKIVDFELAVDTSNLSNEDTQKKLIKWYASKDVGIALAQDEDSAFQITEDLAQNSEQYSASKTALEAFIGPDYTWKVDRSTLTQSDQQAYDNQFARMKPYLEKKAKLALHQEYADAKADGIDYVGNDEQEFINKKLENQTAIDAEIVMINITLPYLLKERGINASEATIQHLQQTTSPFIHERTVPLIAEI
ncbi:MAG: hypothetical protein ABIO02_04720 [Patescibacteria group bacterium]